MFYKPNKKYTKLLENNEIKHKQQNTNEIEQISFIMKLIMKKNKSTI